MPHTQPSARLDAGLLARWAVAARAALAAHRDSIDGLNVFPVPDADTGTNMFLTLDAAVGAVLDPAQGHGTAARDGSDGDAHDEVLAELDRFARAALLGARGNSGVIVSQLVRGLVDSLRDLPPGAGGADPAAVAAAFQRAADTAYGAVTDPAEGTILTVAQRAAGAAREAAEAGGDLAAVVTASTAAGRAALDDTTGQLGALSRAGVVDAGGAGLVVVLDALRRVVVGADAEPTTGSAAGAPAGSAGGAWPASSPVAGVAVGGPGPEGRCVAPEAAYDGPGQEVMAVLPEADQDVVDAVRPRLAALGDSLLLVAAGPTGPWRLHVHTDDVDAVLATVHHLGPVDVTVSDLRGEGPAADARSADRHAEAVAGVCDAGPTVRHAGPRVVAVAAHGVGAVLARAGARVVDPAATRDLADLAPGTIVLAAPEAPLPDDARRVDAPTDAHLVAAAALLDPDVAAGDQLDELRAGLAAVRAVVLAGDELDHLARAVPGLLDDDTALVTVVVGGQGEDARDDALRRLDALVHDLAPDAETTVVEGGSPAYALTVGAER